MDGQLEAILWALSWGAIWGLVLGGIACRLTRWIAVQYGGNIGNLAPLIAVAFVVLAFGLGLVLGTFTSLVSSWNYWRMILALAGAASLYSLAMLRLSAVWPRNDSRTLVYRLNDAVAQLSRSGREEQIVSFRPPRRAGNYEILIAGEETPAWIVEGPLEGLWIQYPGSCGRITDTSSKPYEERTGPEEYCKPTCGGLLWGAGWFSTSSWLKSVKVPWTLKIEKAAGKPTELVLRKRDRIIELVELR